MKKPQIFIFAAGKGSRIAKYTKNNPKSLLKINGESIIEGQVKLFKNLGLDDITVIVGYKHTLIHAALKKYNLKYIYNPFYEITNVIGSLWFTLPFQKKDFIYVHADTMYEEKVIKKLLNTPGDIVLAIDKRKCGEEEMKVVVSDGKIFEVNKTMDASRAYGEVMGLGKISKKLIPLVKQYTETLLEEKKFNQYIEAIIQKMIDDKSAVVKVANMEGLKWGEVDFEEDYKKALKLFQKN